LEPIVQSPDDPPAANLSRSWRDPDLREVELGTLLPILRASDCPYAAAMMLTLLTLARGEERDVAQRAHAVPLSRQATRILHSRPPIGNDGQTSRPDWTRMT
jgi:hypothetical protein